jgi:glutamine synthetase
MKPMEVPLPPGTHTVAMGIADLNGIMRGKRFPASQWKTVCESGNALSIALFAMDATSGVFENSYVNMGNGFPDMHMFPLSQPVPTPWEPGVAFCIGRAEGMDHKPVPIDPRVALVRQVERARAMGFEVMAGTELEFYLVDAQTRLPRDNDIQVYSLSRAAELEHVLGPIRSQINEMGIPIEQSNPEYGPGQAEVNIRYDEALLAADRVVMFRTLVKQLAATQGYIATFMAKPYIDQSGSGFHTHYSLRKDGKNAFSSNGKLNELGMQFLAGLQRHMGESALAGSLTPNAFRRRKPYSFCPTNNSWGYDNRTVALRVIEGAPAAVRIEKRDAAADCNPYFLLACDIAAGLDGIEHGWEPTPPCLGDAYADDRFEPLPTDLPSAIAAAKGSAFMERVLGKDLLSVLLILAEREAEFVANQVTPVERERYLGNL